MDWRLPLWGCEIPRNSRPLLDRALPLQELPALDRIGCLLLRIFCTGRARVDARQTEILSIFEGRPTELLSKLW